MTPEDKNEAVRRSEGEQHIDLFSCHPAGTTAELIERVSADDERVERFWRATYVGASAEPHTDAECPFRDHPIIQSHEVDRPLAASQQPEEKFPAPREDDCDYGCCQAGDVGLSSEAVPVSPQPERPQPVGEDDADEWIRAAKSDAPDPERPQPDERERLIVDSARENCPDEATWEAHGDRLIEEARIICSGWEPKSVARAQRQRADEAEGERDDYRERLAAAFAREDEFRAERDEAKDALKSLAERKLTSMESMASERDQVQAENTQLRADAELLRERVKELERPDCKNPGLLWKEREQAQAENSQLREALRESDDMLRGWIAQLKDHPAFGGMALSSDTILREHAALSPDPQGK